MTVATSSSRIWPTRRWVALFLLILLGQIACIFWLTGKPLSTTRAVPFVPHVFAPIDPRAELPDVSSPMLFVLANRQGFSGPAWLQIPSQQFDSPPWSEELRPLVLDARMLGGELAATVNANASDSFQLTLPLPPQSDFLFPDDLAAEPHSMLTLAGGLARRQLRSQPDLAAWPANDILTNSVVLAAVDAQGSVFSAVLLQSCGSDQADASAVKLAASAQFQPVRWAGPGMADPEAEKLAWGHIVFHWHTIPEPATNNVAP